MASEGAPGKRGDEVRPFLYLVHAPTISVSLLRHAAEVVEAASVQLPGETIFFPRREDGERQPIALEGYVTLKDIADLISYLADMLEP